jgi:thioesterase domain-containing protein/acyl carrier protein
MVPSVFVQLDELPLTPNGKIDRKALPTPSSIVSDMEREFVAHRDALELQLVKIWETILGVTPIGIQDNFFELGGHSLQAVRMFAEVEETFGKNIPLATLFEAGTVEKLATILRQDGWSAPESSLVAIQPEGTKPPFFCIHAKGGNVLFYRDLAQYLGMDQPFYGLQARRLGGRQVGHATVEEMAEFYIKEIQALQPHGPYYIGGSSFGGLAAFEIAHQLHDKGEKVGLLALFDTGTPDYPKLLSGTTVLRSRIYETIRRIQHHHDSLRAFNSRERREYVLDKLRKTKLKYRRKIVNTYKKAARKFFLKVKGQGSIPKKYIQIEDQIWKAGQKYRPTVYPGNMTLFRATNQPLGIEPDPTLGWAGLAADGIEIHDIPGHHGSIVAEPYVRVLAEQLNICLASAQRDPGPVLEKPQLMEAKSPEFAKMAGI